MRHAELHIAVPILGMEFTKTHGLPADSPFLGRGQKLIHQVPHLGVTLIHHPSALRLRQVCGHSTPPAALVLFFGRFLTDRSKEPPP